MTAEATKIDQSDDFIALEIDGKLYEIDLYEARNKLAQVDVAHANDPWTCFACFETFHRATGDTSTTCPKCGDPNNSRDECWLDDVVAVVKGYGVPRCSRNGAGQFYNAVLERLEEIKKKLSPTPGSPTGTAELTPVAGAAAESLPS